MSSPWTPVLPKVCNGDRGTVKDISTSATDASMNQRAPKIYRLTGRKDIDRVFKIGSRVNDRRLTLLAAPNDFSYSRVGVGVSTRHGSAVRRNRMKRLCREAFRLLRDDLPTGYDYMLIPRPGESFTLKGLQESLLSLALRACESQEHN